MRSFLEFLRTTFVGGAFFLLPLALPVWLLGRALATALARIEDAWLLAFIMERHDDGLLTVFVPSAPTPAVGTIYYLTEERVRRIDVPVQAAAKLIMRLGVGSAELLRGKIDPVPRR
jgi:uncharacterized membrane protein